PMSVMALTIAKPADCKLDIVKISDVKGIMETSPNDNYMILIKGPKEAFELVQNLPEIKEINFGGVSKKSESKQYGKAVFLTPEELEATKKILDQEVKIFVQQVPSSSIENVDFSK
ncbi:PTS sugar transporter subunit IIB, partial [Enterococcus faecium]|nr:PTS sugar transporter subunit IIB [Enterococcus faecium]